MHGVISRAALAAAAAIAALVVGSAPVSAAQATRTTLVTATPTISVGQEAKLKAVVKPVSGTAKPSGTVTFRKAGTSVGSAPLVLDGTVMTAKLVLTNLTIGEHTFTATYAGNATFESSTSLAVVIKVSKATTTTKLVAKSTEVMIGQPTVLKAVVKPVVGGARPTGSVTFRESGAVVGVAPLVLVGTQMVAKLELGPMPVGQYDYRGTYGGSGTFLGSESTLVTVRVAKASTTTTVKAEPATTAGKYALVARVETVAPGRGAPTGTVTFVVDGGAPQVVALGDSGSARLSATFAPGTSHTVRATYSGDSQRLTSSDSLTFTA